MSYADQLTAQLRSAHVTALKQRYLDLIEEAKRQKKNDERRYFDDAKQAYVEKQKGLVTTPQQLSALGIGGGRGDEELASIVADYNETMEKLKRRRSEQTKEYDYIVDKQTRLMNNAINEYNARIALEDYKAAAKSAGSSSRSGSGSGGSTNTASVPSESGSSGGLYIAPEVEDFLDRLGYKPVTQRPKEKA